MLDPFTFYLMFFFFGQAGVLIPERKRPRKLSQKVLECAIEEVAVGAARKKVRLLRLKKEQQKG